MYEVGGRFKSLDTGRRRDRPRRRGQRRYGSGINATSDPRGRTVTISGAPSATVTVPFGAATVQTLSDSVKITLTGGELVTQGDRWTIKIGAKDYSFDAAALASATQPASVDVMLTDDDAPGVLILETNGNTTP